jgi:imidazolonepropionase-like amidohydrolase
MPGLVEGHCHLFLDGDELDFVTRAEHLKQPFDALLAAGRQSLARNLDAGVTLLRDAGDIHGVNTRLKQEPTGGSPAVISAGVALRKARRYGSFMAREAQGMADLPEAVRALAPAADQLKVLLTGIIDFETGTMKGGVQFTVEEAALIVATARGLGKLTFCHCSGLDGLRIAVDAGFDAIEHGFFMTRDMLAVMRDKQIAWVPTFTPVDFQWRHPDHCGWDPATCGELRKILDNHDEHLVAAYEMGVPVITGSDAGSYGVPHGRGLIQDLVLMRAAGAPVDGILASATSVPRRIWGQPAAGLRAGEPANLVCLAGSPYDDMEHLRRPLAVCHHGWQRLPAGVQPAARSTAEVLAAAD